MTIKRLFDASCYIGRWPSSEPVAQEIGDLLMKMDSLGIEKALVNHTLSWQYSPRFGNDRLINVIANQPRLEACWGITPGVALDDYGGVAGFEQALDKNNVRAVRIFPRDHVIPLADWIIGDLFPMFNRKRMVVLMDLDQVFLQVGMYDYDANGLAHIKRLCNAYPELSFVLTRVGYRAYQTLLGLLSCCPNLYIDLSYLGTHMGVEDIARRFDSTRLLFGTSFPFVEPGGALGRLQFSSLPDEQKNDIAYGNLERLLNRVRKVSAVEFSYVTPKLIQPEIEITDAHGHLGPYFKFAIPDSNAQGMVDAMDAAGVHQVCISSHLAISGDWKIGNEITLEAVKQFPQRLIGHVVVSPNEPHLILPELRHYLDDCAFKAIKVVPDTHMQSITSKGYEPMWAFAAERKCLVCCHTFHGSTMDDPGLFAEIARRYPEVPVLIVHSGALQAAFNNAIQVARQYSNLYLDVSGSYITSPWIKRMVDELGPEKVIYSSDIPFIDVRYSLGRVIYAGLTPEQLRLVLGGNIRRILGLRI